MQFTVPARRPRATRFLRPCNWIFARARRSSSRRTSGRRAPGGFLRGGGQRLQHEDRARSSVPQPATRFRPPTGRQGSDLRRARGSGKRQTIDMVQFRGGTRGDHTGEASRHRSDRHASKVCALRGRRSGTDFRVFRKTGDEAYAPVASVQDALVDRLPPPNSAPATST